MFKTLLASAAITATLAMASLAAAQTIDTTPAWDGLNSVAAFGGSGSGSTGVYGQTFSAPNTAITGFTFHIDNHDVDLNVVAQVYAWSGSLGVGGGAQQAIGPALFSSSFLIEAFDGFQDVHVDTGLTALNLGGNYVILLADISNDLGEANWGLVSGDPPVAFNGAFKFYNNDYTLASINSNAWDNADGFGSLAYTATFAAGETTAVPEPASWALMIGGFGMAGAVLRRRRALALAA
ncbi:PEPxxWA-CTERM sorting domain-containing protein [uncultured Phenylobacterium sp.]|uniref:PEPxxWA-CTERM sorting domain-containing protein n=1 Tax=uncultured Phenylobacterium sp. TaxID=349273 RepID=UPI0025D57B1F|nr:PEPxxWA-CTERM sorting domain-containing protein [uncultured Phenylobacterium sp.]